MERRAVVLAGGFGKRIQHVLPDLPKPLAPVNGKPFLEWVVRWLRHQGVQNIVISSGHMAEKTAAAAKALDVDCVAEAEPLGTAGGFLNAIAGRGDGAWLVCNGDSLALADLGPVFGDTAAILGVRVPDASRFGSLDVAGGRLKGFAEKKPGAGLINAGVYFFTGREISSFPAQRPLSFETEVFPRLEGIRVVETDAPFLDIGTEATLKMADRFISSNMERF